MGVLRAIRGFGQQFEGMPIVPFLVGAVACVFLCLFYEYYACDHSGKRRFVFKNVAVGITFLFYITFVIYITILRRGMGERGLVALVPFQGLLSEGEVAKFLALDVLNIILFIPLSFLLCSFELLGDRRVPMWLSGAICIVGSAGIEITQLAFKLGAFETEDMICNALGAVLGCAVFKLHKRNREYEDS